MIKKSTILKSKPKPKSKPNTCVKPITEEKEIVISVKTSIYPLDAIYGASYAFIDKAYIFLDSDTENKINIRLKLKLDAIHYFKTLKELKDEFLNELLNFSLRQRISKENKQLREYIVGAALLGATGEINIYQNRSQTENNQPIEVIGEGKSLDAKNVDQDTLIKNEDEDTPSEEINVTESFDDPLGIAVPWEEKFAK